MLIPRNFSCCSEKRKKRSKVFVVRKSRFQNSQVLSNFNLFIKHIKLLQVVVQYIFLNESIKRPNCVFCEMYAESATRTLSLILNGCLKSSGLVRQKKKNFKGQLRANVIKIFTKISKSTDSK